MPVNFSKMSQKKRPRRPCYFYSELLNFHEKFTSTNQHNYASNAKLLWPLNWGKNPQSLSLDTQMITYLFSPSFLLPALRFLHYFICARAQGESHFSLGPVWFVATWGVNKEYCLVLYIPTFSQTQQDSGKIVN